jgi:hypothetical protein
MKCERAFVYFSRGKPVAYTLIVNGTEKPIAPEGLKVVETSFVRAYVRFASIRANWNADGTPHDAGTLIDNSMASATE